ncbi:MAG: diadenylate cyclase [Bacteroidales bacterium]|nr:diadenylate cyclase [Bacteroidales bacterium]
MFDFIKISVVDILDIILVGILIFQLLKLAKGTSVFNIFLGILLIYLTWIVVSALNMKLLSSILGQVLGVGVIALIVIFQTEIRRFLLHIGGRYLERTNGNFLTRWLFGKAENEMRITSIDEIAGACKTMSESKTGALIVIQHNASLDFVTQTGDMLDASINRRLIENIFFKNSPLHDGAMVISRDRIVAARCTLPIVKNPNIPPQYGMRHKAAVSISQDTDADAIVVSEETGKISYVSAGELKTITSISELKLSIENSFRKK